MDSALDFDGMTANTVGVEGLKTKISLAEYKQRSIIQRLPLFNLSSTNIY